MADYPQVLTKQIDWDSLVNQVDPPPAKELSYEFSNGRKFLENFNPTTGAYEPEE